MKMFISILALIVSTSVFAEEKCFLSQNLLPHFAARPLNWKVGQETHYKVTLQDYEGDANYVVDSETEKGFWLNFDLTILETDYYKVLYAKADGSLLEYWINGKKCTPEPIRSRVIETKEVEVTVPAGTFKSFYTKSKYDGGGEGSALLEVWENQTEIPIMGIIKSHAFNTGVHLYFDLTSFKK